MTCSLGWWELDPHAHVVQLGGQLLHHAQYQAGGHYLVLYNVGRNQLKGIYVKRGACGDGWRCQRLLPEHQGAVSPGNPRALVEGPDIAADLLLARRPSVVQKRSQPLLDRRGNLPHGTACVCHEALAGFLRNLRTLGK